MAETTARHAKFRRQTMAVDFRSTLRGLYLSIKYRFCSQKRKDDEAKRRIIKFNRETSNVMCVRLRIGVDWYRLGKFTLVGRRYLNTSICVAEMSNFNHILKVNFLL